ncbi:MAG: OmpP1/FadL family transporter [Crocinitomicaceae bacterium]
MLPLRTLLLILLGVFTAQGQGFQVNFQGQKQQGMGCAGSALHLDAASLFFNPGASAFANKSEVNLAGTPIFANVLYTDSSSQTSYRTNNPVGTPFSAYGLYRFKNKLVPLSAGLAIYTPFGSTVQWEPNWIGRFAITRLSLKAIFIQPTFSYRINERFGIGGGFILSCGNVNLQKDIPVQDSLGNFGHATLSGKALGFGYNVGLLYQLNHRFSIGFTYRSKVIMGVNDGKATFQVPNSLTSNFPNGTFASELPLPDVLTLGFSFQPKDKWQFVLDINHVNWKVYDTLAFDYALNTSSLSDTKSARNYKSIFAFRGGASYTVGKKLSVRLGGGFGLTPVQAGFVTPETPDANRFYGTFGISYRFNGHFSMDSSCYGTKLVRTDKNLESQLNGTFRTVALAPGLSLNYTW